MHARRTITLLVGAAVLAAPTTALADGVAAQAPRIVVDLSDQTVTLIDTDGDTVATYPASTGSPETPTPTGRYRVTSKSTATFAVNNPRVTMRHMVRFNGGIGFHSIPRKDGRPLDTPLGERGVSHGCVRLADRDARELYRNTPIGTLVIVRP